MKTFIDDGLITCAVFIDFSKAFDTVNYKILLAKLSKYGIRGHSLEWFNSYLTNRRQFVKVQNEKSSLLPNHVEFPKVRPWVHCCFWSILMI